MTTGRNLSRASLTRRIAGGTGAIGEAITAARDFAAAAALPDDVADRLAIVAEELVANLVEHAGFAPGASLGLDLACDGARIRLTLADPCPPFDPRGATAPDMVPPARGGGAGLALVRAWSNIVAYDRIGAENRLSLEMALD